MSTDPIPILLSAALIVSVVAGLFARGVSTSLIMLFYSSIILALIFTYYGDALIAVVEMATFAGAISVVMLAVILMTGESDLRIGARPVAVSITAVTLLVVSAAILSIYPSSLQSSAVPASDISLQVFAFIWQFRPWDLLILVTVFASTMIAVVNLLSKVRQQ